MKIMEVLDADAALKTGGNFFGIVFKAFQTAYCRVG